jgi:hypothetical protein
MRIRELVERHKTLPRDLALNEAQLTVHVEDEFIMADLLRTRGDGEIVERKSHSLEGLSTVYVRCADNDGAAELMEAWVPYLPYLPRLPSELIVERPIARSYRVRAR